MFLCLPPPLTKEPSASMSVTGMRESESLKIMWKRAATRYYSVRRLAHPTVFTNGIRRSLYRGFWNKGTQIMILASSFKEALHGIFCSIQRFLCPYIRMIYPICSYSSASFITPVINAVTAFSGNLNLGRRRTFQYSSSISLFKSGIIVPRKMPYPSPLSNPICIVLYFNCTITYMFL